MNTEQRKTKTPYAHCWECPLKRSPGMFGRGDPKDDGTVDVLFIGEAPGRSEIALHKVFVGPSGKLLAGFTSKLDLGHIWLTNAALCFAKDDQEKTSAVACCRDRLMEKIKELRPRLIVTLGNIPTNVILGKGLGITKRRGRIEYVDLPGLGKFPVLPTFHPAYILRSYSRFPELSRDMQYVERFLKKNVIIIKDFQPTFEVTTDYAKVLREAERSPLPVLDLETTGLRPHQDKLLCATIATERNIYILPEETLYNPDFIRALEGCKAQWSGHNAKFDHKMLRTNLGIHVPFAFDSMLAHYLYDEGSGDKGGESQSLKRIATDRYGAPDWEAPIREFKKRKAFKDYGDIPTETLYRYAAQDGFWQRKVTEEYSAKLLQNEKFRWIFETILVPLIHTLANMELKGMRLDIEGLHRLKDVYDVRADGHAQRMFDLAGHEFNPRSPQQVAVVMYDELGIPKMPGQGRSTNADKVLRRFPVGKYPFIQALLEYREVHTLLKMYVNSFLRKLAGTDRLHTTFNPAGTVTGRLSSENPNLQNVPRKTKDIKTLFLADEGNSLLDSDYSQIELRLIALLSGDPFMIGCYREGRDLHGEMAQELFGSGYTSEQRSLAKTFNFELAYGRSVAAIAADGSIELSPEEAQRLQLTFFRRIPKVVEWIEATHRVVHEKHYVETPTGRRRRFPFLPSNRRALGEIYREAVNMLPQSAASEATLLSLVRLDQAGFDLRLTVHDNIVSQCPERDVQDVQREQERIMIETAEELYGNVVPFEVSTGIGKNWGELT